MTSTTFAQLARVLGLDDDAGLFDVIKAMEEHIAFNRVLGLEIIELSPGHAAFRFESRPDLIGNPQKQSLHGGVISAALDTVGGIVAMAALIDRAGSVEEALESLMRVGTIDLRVDYLRPAVGHTYTATAYPQRIGRTVASTRMELHDEAGTLLAVGSGTYIVG